MPRHLALVLLCLTSGLVGCGDASPPGETLSVSETDSAGVPSIVVGGGVDLLPVWRLGAAPTFEVRGDEAPYLSDIGEVAVRADGSFVVEDNQSASVWLFEPDSGSRALGGRGDGPGEFRNVVSVTADAHDSIFVFDRRHARVTVFDPAGVLARVVDLPRGIEGEGTILTSAWPYAGGLLLHSVRFTEPGDASAGMRLDSRTSFLRRTDPDGQPDGRVVEVPAGLALVNQRFDGRSPFSADAVIAVRDGLVVHGRGADYVLEYRDRGLDAIRAVRWPGSRRPVTPELVARSRAEVEERFEQAARARPERVAALVDQMFAPEVVPDALPALGRVHLDDEGRAWVQSYRLGPETWDQRSAWHVLDPDGRPLARLTLPPDTRLAAVHGGQVVVVTRDSLDVQRIAAYPLDTSNTAAAR